MFVWIETKEHMPVSVFKLNEDKSKMHENNGITRIAKFSGKKEDFLMWLSQFLAICAMKGVCECFDGTWKIQLPAK